jgi:subtilisin family serine protease
MKRKVTVTTNLNQRIGEPSLNAPCYAYLAKGSIIEVDGHLYEGDTYKDIDKWYKDEAGNYYWSGGIYDAFLENQNDQSFRVSLSRNDKNVFDLFLEIQKTTLNLPNGTGTGTTVAILDSGINTNFPSLKDSINEKRIKNYLSSSGFYSHATKVAGLLVANNDKLLGICPEATLWDLRVANKYGNVAKHAVVNALDDIYHWNFSKSEGFCDIINMSLDIDHDYPNLQDKIDNLILQGSIIIVSGTTGSYTTSISNLKGVIPIGALVKSDLENISNEIANSSLKSIFLNKNILSTSNYPDHELFGDSSAYTAIVSGLVARFLSSENIKKEDRLDRVIDFLKNISIPIQNIINPKPLTSYKL